MGASLIDEPLDAEPDRPTSKGQGRRAMQAVSCVIRPERLEAVKDALATLDGVGGMTVADVRGFGRQKGQVEHYRGGEYTIRFIPKVRIDLVVPAEAVGEVMAAVQRAAHTGQVGDGKLFVMEVRQALRIRTGERGAEVL